MIDVDDAIRNALHGDAALAPRTPDHFRPGAIGSTALRHRPTRWKPLAAAAAALVIVGAMWAVSERSSDDGVPVATTAVPDGPANIFLVVDAAGWTITMAQVNADQVSSTYRAVAGDDNEGRAGIVVTTGRLAPDPLPRLRSYGQPSKVVIGDREALWFSSEQISSALFDFGDGRLAEIDFELMSDEEIAIVIDQIRFTDQNEFESFATRQGVDVQHPA